MCAVDVTRLEILVVFLFNDTATTEIYTLSLHDALPIVVSVACVDPNVEPITFIGPRFPAPRCLLFVGNTYIEIDSVTIPCTPDIRE